MREIPLTKGKVALVDDADYAALSRFTWYATWKKSKWRGLYYYAVRREYPKTIYMHRELLGLVPGDGWEADHRNFNTLDNRRENLRRCTRQEQLRNTRGWSQIRPHKGVYWQPPRGGRSGLWRYRLMLGDGRQIHRSAPTEAEAVRLYREAVRLHFGDFAPELDSELPESN